MKYRIPAVYCFQYFASSLDQGGQADFLRKQRSSTFSQFEFCLIAWDGQRWVLGEAGSKLWDCRLLRRKWCLKNITIVISNTLQVIWVLMVHIHIVWWSIEGKSLSVRSIWWAMWNHYMTCCLRAKYNVEVIWKTCGASASNTMRYSCNHVLLWTCKRWRECSLDAENRWDASLAQDAEK